jgi:hypothetical protein
MLRQLSEEGDVAGPGDFYQDLMDQQARAMKQYQDSISETMKAFADAFSPQQPARPAATGLTPDPTALADGYFSFASEVLKRQHEFVLKLIEVMAPPR